MDVRLRTLALLSVVGLAALVNPLWLFPAEGETQYVYERSEITVQDGQLTYLEDPDAADPGFPEFDLNGIDCQFEDGFDRGCAFDYQLVQRGPAAVPEEVAGPQRGGETYALLNGTYYRRNTTRNETATTYSVEQVTPQTVLAELSFPVTKVAADDLSDGTHPAYRAAVSGEAVTALEPPEDNDRGTASIYRDGETYFTVVVSDRPQVDHPVFGEWVRALLYVLGLVLVVLGPFLMLAESRDWNRGA